MNSNEYAYAHLDVDRFAILFDLWTNEVEFLEAKRNVRHINPLLIFNNDYFILLIEYFYFVFYSFEAIEYILRGLSERVLQDRTTKSSSNHNRHNISTSSIRHRG
jgi:hypothetical protein